MKPRLKIITSKKFYNVNFKSEVEIKSFNET